MVEKITDVQIKHVPIEPLPSEVELFHEKVAKRKKNKTAGLSDDDTQAVELSCFHVRLEEHVRGDWGRNRVEHRTRHSVECGEDMSNTTRTRAMQGAAMAFDPSTQTAISDENRADSRSHHEFKDNVWMSHLHPTSRVTTPQPLLNAELLAELLAQGKGKAVNTQVEKADIEHLEGNSALVVAGAPPAHPPNRLLNAGAAAEGNTLSYHTHHRSVVIEQSLRLRQSTVKPLSPAEDNRVRFDFSFLRWSGDHSVRVALQPQPVQEGSLILQSSDILAAEALKRHLEHLPAHLAENLRFADHDQEREGRRQPDEREEDEA